MTISIRWTDEEVESLIRMVEGHTPLPELCRGLGRTREEVEAEAFQLAISVALEKSQTEGQSMFSIAA